MSAKKQTPRTLTVQQIADLTPHLRRITLGGPGLEGFPADSAGNYFKLVLPGPQEEPGEANKPLLRTYTIRLHDDDALTLAVDVVRHPGQDQGPGAVWAESVQVGDAAEIRGPGNGQMVDVSADGFVLVSDLAGLPALAANLETIPAEKPATVVVEVPTQADCFAFSPALDRDNVALRWVVLDDVKDKTNNQANTTAASEPPLLQAVRPLAWPEGRVYVWCACEFESMKPLRRHFKLERGVAPLDLYISSYWKRGLQESEHKTIKRADAEQQES